MASELREMKNIVILTAIVILGFPLSSVAEETSDPGNPKDCLKWFTPEYCKNQLISSTDGEPHSDLWTLYCEKDSVDDKIGCDIRMPQGSVHVIYLDSKTPIEVCVSQHDFPGRRGAIRIDRNKSFTTDESGCVPAKAIITQLKSGKTVLARRYEWPYDYGQDTTSTLEGMKEALDGAAAKRARFNKRNK